MKYENKLKLVRTLGALLSWPAHDMLWQKLDENAHLFFESLGRYGALYMAGAVFVSLFLLALLGAWFGQQWTLAFFPNFLVEEAENS